MASDFIDAPIMLEAQKWLREEKGVIVELTFAYIDEKRNKYYLVQILILIIIEHFYQILSGL